METLNPEQIQNWRRFIARQLDTVSPGSGIYAIIMPESEVVEFWRKTKSVLESPIPEPEVLKAVIPMKCKHENSITGQNGKYCIDCEKYV
jgi:hypothetical protein